MFDTKCHNLLYKVLALERDYSLLLCKISSDSLFLLFLLNWETFDSDCCEDMTQQCQITAGEIQGLSLCRELFYVNRVEFDGI